MATEPDERKSDLAVMGEMEYDQKRRLERLHDWPEYYKEVRNDIWEMYVLGQVDYDARCIQELHAVQHLLMLLWPMSHDHRHQDHHRYWNNTEEPDWAIGYIPFQGREDKWFMDLEDVLRAQDYYTEIIEETEEKWYGQEETVKRKNDKPVPLDVIHETILRTYDYLVEEYDMHLKTEPLNDDKIPMIKGFDQSREDGDEPMNTEVEYTGDPDL